MILKRPTDQEVYQHLIDNYYRAYSIIEISKAIKKSMPMVYKSIKILKSNGLILENGTKYNIDISNNHTSNYKYLYDYEKFLNLPDKYKDKILILKEKVNSIMPAGTGFSMVIFGSLTDGTFDEKSDMDILLILEKGSLDSLSTQMPEGFHFLLKHPLQFLKEIVDGGDIALSICKSHIIIKDNNKSFIGSLKRNKNEVDNKIILFRKNEARNLRQSILNLFIKNKKDEIIKKLILEKIQKLIKTEANIICLENNIIPSSKINSFEEASKILNRNIKKEYQDININNVLDKVKSYV